ncbi:putative histidine kinase/response regulator [Trichoderma atroviride IMI 206040]|uniref:Histidine kinase/response regulator n=1 Tax=Hypocrea atroviridis (strain ATCC 20476 / IMI 206040) TaxID=452589 RepID=G9P2P3_HYPAI|nr:putative histidine kinase/response regulator [Trichoderma atroviride IMI 206040]EHK43602.1 putative histidine kinase/response regulator [Trichoderma atroviride IMI 206040]
MDGRPVPPYRAVSEATRQRETFKYDPTLLSTSKVNDSGQLRPSSELTPSQDLVLTGLAQLALFQTGTERAFISLFDVEHQYFIAEATRELPIAAEDSSLGLWMCGTAIPRAHSTCEYTLLESHRLERSSGSTSLERDATQFDHCENEGDQLPVLVVKDLATDARFKTKPYCQPEGGNHFYASVPIRTQRGINIGSLCVVSSMPNCRWNGQFSTLMRRLSLAVMDHLEANSSKIANKRSERMIRGLGFFVEGKATASSRSPAAGRETFTETPDALRLARQALLKDGEAPSKQPLPEVTPEAKQAKPVAETKWADTFIPGPNPMVDTFSEAAQTIRESLETDGCLFLDSSAGSFGEYGGRTKGSRKNRASNSPSRGDESSSEDEDDDSGSDSKKWPACQVLGYSTTESRSKDLEDGSLPRINMAQRFLAKLLQRYPKGHIFNFGINGELQSSDSSDDDGWMTDPSKDSDNMKSVQPAPQQPVPDDASQSKRHRRPWARHNEGRIIQEMFPKARSVAFVPVWDPRKQRWCAGGFIYTLTPTRIFTVGAELNFLKAVSILAIAETLRLKTFAANQAKSDALSSLSHELRSPLHGAVLGIELLRDTELTVFQGNIAHTIEICCRTLVDTVDHLLDYSKVNKFIQARKTGGQTSEPRGLRQSTARSVEEGMLSLYKHIRLDGIVEEVMDGVYAGFNFMHMALQLAKHKTSAHSTDFTAMRRLDAMQAVEELGSNGKVALGEVTVFLEIDHDCNWRFYTQPGAIRRIVMNLLGNSLKYTQRGSIKVRLSQSKPKRKSSADAVVNIVVSDTGKGIGEDYLRNDLYKPFSQEDHLAPGTGLGLSFVKQITSQLRGRVHVESRVSVGTIVRVSLPLMQTVNAPDGTPQIAENEGDFDKHVAEATGLRVSLMGFDIGKRGRRRMLDGSYTDLQVEVDRNCREWLGLKVITEAEANEKAPDCVIWVEDTLAASPPDEIMHGPPCVVLCRNTLVAFKSAAQFERVKAHRIFEFIAQPLTFCFFPPSVGPRKLAKAVAMAFRRGNEMKSIPITPSAAREETGEPTLETAKEDEATPEPEFLLVEDNNINLDILAIYMKKLGRAYHTATNGSLAVEAYRENPNHCKYIFMDVSMPVMDGFEATRRIRAYEREHQLKPCVIFALTGLASESAQQEAFGSGVDLFLTKPVKLKELGMILRSRGLLPEEPLVVVTKNGTHLA